MLSDSVQSVNDNFMSSQSDDCGSSEKQCCMKLGNGDCCQQNGKVLINSIGTE